MPDDVQVKQFELPERDALLSFLRSAYPGEPLKSDPAFWEWHHLENPYARPDNLPVWVVKSRDLVVGQLAAIPMRLKVGRDEMSAVWVVNIILDPDYRGRGLGKRLFQVAAETYCPRMVALGYNEASGAILRSFSWVDLGHINRYHIMLYPGHAAKEVSRLAPARHLLNLVYAPFRPGSSRLAKAGDGALREVTRFDSSFDQLWEGASIQWPCAMVRSSRFLEWQFMKQPGKKFDVLGYYEGERLLGYVVLFFRKAVHGGASDKVAISDLCYDARNAPMVVEGLLKGALRLAIERRAGGLVIDVLDPRVEQQLSRLGFWRVKSSPGFMAGTFERLDLLYERSNWFLTRGDSDVSIFEEPNL
ncbi:MAG TPA: GNAT family N-acetyltransferase [Pyrinomonadaceae bacterium]|nr:GNAT family N-acetyltransferase [Pyrinomonadaceae bacterium]